MATENKSTAPDNLMSEEELRAQIRVEIEAEYAAKAKEDAKSKAKAAVLAAKTYDPTRRVKIKLFKDSGKYKDPLFVSVGNYRAAIPRGIEVDVPFYVSEHIRETLEQDQQTAELIAMRVEEYERNKDRLE